MSIDGPGTGASYAGLAITDNVSGDFRIGAAATGSTFVAPDTYEFPGAAFFGRLMGDGQATSTEGSSRPLEVRFSDDLPASQEIVDLLADLKGIVIALNTPVDLAEIETDITQGNHRIEFGVSFLSLDTSVLSGTSYQEFPSLEEVTVAVYFIVEEIDESEVLNILGEITEFGLPEHSIPVLPIGALLVMASLLTGLVIYRRR